MSAVAASRTICQPTSDVQEGDDPGETEPLPTRRVS